jgi:DNA polymerase-3 subunit gamma/tau
MVVVSSEAGERTVNSQNEAKRNAMEQGVRSDPLVQAVLARFPGAEIVGVRRRDDGAANVPSASDDPLPNPDDYGADDDDR